MKEFDYICKLDDDVFPLTENWFEKLCKTYKEQKSIYGDELGYVTSLVNNNPWGSGKVLDILNLRDEYVQKYSREHYVGFNKKNKYLPLKFIPKGEFNTGGAGTIWKLAYVARWIHQETTLQPEKYINATVGRGVVEVNNEDRYSINCMLFKKDFWNKIDIGSSDDEHQTHVYCKKNNKKIIADLEVPMVHLFFYPQRNENKDMITPIREYYQNWLGLNFPISICPDKQIEIENRLRFLETNIICIAHDMETHTNKMFKNKLKYFKYRVLSEITFGKVRHYYKEKKLLFKKMLKK